MRPRAGLRSRLPAAPAAAVLLAAVSFTAVSPAAASAPSGMRSLAAFDTSAAGREWLERWRGTFPSLGWGAFAREGRERGEARWKPEERMASDWERVSTIRWSPSKARALYWCGCKEEVKEIRLARPADSTCVTLRSYGQGHEAFDAFWPSESVVVLTHLRPEGKRGASRLVLEVIDLARRVHRTWTGPRATASR